MKNSGEIVEKTHFAHSFTVILALITYHDPTIMKWSIEFCPSRFKVFPARIQNKHFHTIFDNILKILQ